MRKRSKALKKKEALKKEKVLDKILRGMLYSLPIALFFSYYPVISFGGDATMNFELSITLIWLVLFDLISLVAIMRRMIKQKRKVKEWFLIKWKWLLFPAFVVLSLFWTKNLVRGVLTTGVLGLVYLAIFAFFELKDLWAEKSFKKRFWFIFFGATIVFSIWCVVQCVLDVVGVPRNYTLMCAGCVTKMFGFPHPNGFAIEPQFMGNLLIAPALMSGFMFVNASRKSYAVIFFIISATLFLTFSRGAIYAFVIAILILAIYFIVRKKWKAWRMLGIMFFAFIFTLVLQGVFASVSNTNDTFFSGTAKVLNHLSLGVVDVSAPKIEKEASESLNNGEENLEFEVRGGSFSTSQENLTGVEKNNAVFDGYVIESTNVRLELTRASMATWGQDFRTIMFGVGIGGAGEAMFEAGEIDSPKEIVQNEYSSLLLELGIVGVLLFVVTIGMAILVVWQSEEENRVILVLIVAYGVTLCFFSGMVNALQIYLLPAVFLKLNLKDFCEKS